MNNVYAIHNIYILQYNIVMLHIIFNIKNRFNNFIHNHNEIYKLIKISNLLFNIKIIT